MGKERSKVPEAYRLEIPSCEEKIAGRSALSWGLCGRTTLCPVLQSLLQIPLSKSNLLLQTGNAVTSSKKGRFYSRVFTQALEGMPHRWKDPSPIRIKKLSLIPSAEEDNFSS